MRQVTVLDHATVTLTDEGCYTTFGDGTTWGALPHDTPHYDEIAERCGYLDWETRATWPADPTRAQREAARMAYCREHEVFHHVVGAVFYRAQSSPVLWALAHGLEVDEMAAAVEEAMVMTVQRWVRAGERPIIGGVDWDDLRARCLALLDE
jgi:hypothetical protein